MTKQRGRERLRSACARGTAIRLAEKYVQYCREQDPPESAEAKRSAKLVRRFPNLAGFCRYLGIGTEDLHTLSEEFPQEGARLLAIFEDEALNSSLPPALLSTYLKRRLGYERGDREDDTSPYEPLQISFEHDILEDGE